MIKRIFEHDELQHNKVYERKKYLSYGQMPKKPEKVDFFDIIISDLEGIKTQIKSRGRKSNFVENYKENLKKNIEESRTKLRSHKQKHQYVKRLYRSTKEPTQETFQLDGRFIRTSTKINPEETGVKRKTEIFLEVNKLPLTPRKYKVKSLDNIRINEKMKKIDIKKYIESRNEEIKPWDISNQRT